MLYISIFCIFCRFFCLLTIKIFFPPKNSDWYKDISHLIGKVKLKFQQDFQSRDTAQTLVELCTIRDGLSTCNALSHLDACELINLISLD